MDTEIKKDVNLSTCVCVLYALPHMCVHIPSTERVWEQQHLRSDENIPRSAYYFPLKGTRDPWGNR